MTYTAMQYNGSTGALTALPSWLHFNGTTDTFTGTVPSSATGFNIEVTATETGGHAPETFAVSIVGQSGFHFGGFGLFG